MRRAWPLSNPCPIQPLPNPRTLSKRAGGTPQCIHGADYAMDIKFWHAPDVALRPRRHPPARPPLLPPVPRPLYVLKTCGLPTPMSDGGPYATGQRRMHARVLVAPAHPPPHSGSPQALHVPRTRRESTSTSGCRCICRCRDGRRAPEACAVAGDGHSVLVARWRTSRIVVMCALLVSALPTSSS